MRDGTIGSCQEQPRKRHAEYGSVADVPDPFAVKQQDIFLFHGGIIEWLRDLECRFGYKVLVVLSAVEHLLAGVMMPLVVSALPYVYTDYGVDSVDQLIYSAVASMPLSSLQPLFGLVIQTMPVAGYNKTPYYVGSCLLGSTGLLIAGLSSVESLSTVMLVFCMFAVCLQFGFLGVIISGIQTAKIQEHPQHGPQLVSFLWFGQLILVFFTDLSSGLLIEDLGAESLLVVAAVPALLAMVPGLLGYLGDRWQTDADVEAARAEFWAQGELVLLCVLLFAGGVAVAVAGLCASTAAACAVSVCVMAVLLFAHSVLLAPNIAALCVFLMVQGSLSWSIGSVEYYFYTDDAEVYPEGPHFSTVFYNSVLSPASSIAQLGCVWLYGRYMNGWSYRNTMVVGNVAAILTRLMQAAMFARLNVALGISDYILLLVGHTDGRARFLQWLPSMVVASLVCPKGMETTVFALLAACRGFGETVGSDCGALLLEMLGADPDGSVGDEDAFENAWKASLIVSVLPLLTLPFIFALVPDASPSSDRGRLASGQAVEGSLVRRWWGRGARRQLV